jgi:hypothetical protein
MVNSMGGTLHDGCQGGSVAHEHRVKLHGRLRL